MGNVSQVTRDDVGSERSHPPAPDFDELTGLLPGDINAVTLIVNAAEKRIINHVTRMYQKLVSDVKANEALISDLSKTVPGPETNVSNVKVLTLQNYATMARARGNGRSAAKTSNKAPPKSAFQKEIEGQHPPISVEIPAVFHMELLSRGAGHSLCSYMDALHRAQDDHKMTARTFSVVVYGHQRGMLLQELKHGVGKRNANFRFKVALTAIREAFKLTDESFIEQEKQVIADLVREGKLAPGEVEPSATKPSWLSPRLLTRQIMADARKFYDCLKAEQSPMPQAASSRLALHVQMGRCVVKSVMDMLRLARNRCKVKLFDAGFFRFVDWTKLNAFKPGHTQPVLSFVKPSANPIEPGDIPDCAVMSEEHYDVKHAGILKDLISSREEMVIEAKYMVTVVVWKAPRMSKEANITELREIRRHFNVLRMALVFMMAFVHSREEPLLASHPSMLRNVYRLALVLREFFIDHAEESHRAMRATLASSVEGDDRNAECTPSETGGQNSNGARSDLAEVEP